MHFHPIGSVVLRLPAMTSIIDSETHFTKRVKEVELSDAGRRALNAAGHLADLRSVLVDLVFKSLH